MIRAVACALALAVTPALAAEPEVFPIDVVGNWVVMLRTEGGVAPECIAASVNPAEDLVFGLRVDAEGTWALHFKLPGRDMPERAGPLRLDVDYQRFEVQGIAEGEDIYVAAAEFAPLFLAIRDGRALALYSPSGKRIATASLAGSAAALVAFGECFDRIATSPEPDPFI